MSFSEWINAVDEVAAAVQHLRAQLLLPTAPTLPEFAAVADTVALWQRTLQEHSRAHLGALFAAFFVEHPAVRTIHWTQDTVRLDGSAPRFVVGALSFSPLDGAPVEHHPHADPAAANFAYALTEDRRVSAAMQRDMQGLAETVGEMNVHLRRLFGDHCAVRVHPTGWHVDPLPQP